MHLTYDEGVLVTSSVLSLASLMFLFAYLVFFDESTLAAADADCKNVYISRPVMISRAIGADSNAHLRPFRAASFLFGTVLTAARLK